MRNVKFVAPIVGEKVNSAGKKLKIREGAPRYFESNGINEIVPQPDPSSIVILRRIYCRLKLNNDYQRRITMILRIRDEFQQKLNNCIYEYIGSHPQKGAPHGNSKTLQRNYIKTNPVVFEKMERVLLNYRTRKYYMQELVENPKSAPLNMRSVSNKKV